MVKKRGFPGAGELVICRITRINPNSAFAGLEEYATPIEGMIHISEVSSGWVRDIRSHVKIGQTVVAKVMGTDRDHISLSLKRVDRKQEREKIKESNLEQRAEKMLELAARSLGKTLDVAYKDVGFLLLENFGLYEGFKKSLQRPDVLKARGISDEWIQALKDVAEKSIIQKEFEFRAKLYIKTLKPGGINIIKKVLNAAENSGLSVSYISAPEYLLKYKTKYAKKGEKEFSEKLDKIASLTKDADIEFKTI